MYGWNYPEVTSQKSSIYCICSIAIFSDAYISPLKGKAPRVSKENNEKGVQKLSNFSIRYTIMYTINYIIRQTITSTISYTIIYTMTQIQ